MKATFNPNAKTKFTTSHRKERNGFHAEYAVIVPDEYQHTHHCKSPVILRVYWPASTCYACLWVNGEQVHTSGSGSAGGGGYCKESAAAAEAIRNAGITLELSISGVGTQAIEEALLAIAEVVGYPGAMLHKSHA